MSRPVISLRACVLVGTACVTVPAFAADVPTLESIAVSATAGPALDQPAATGTLLGLTPMETPASIEIISREQLTQRGDVSVTDAVARAAGISAFGHPGNGNSSLASRGFTGSTSVTQLYDGVRQYGGVGQTFPFDTWSVDRIEVLRGPASVLYGDGAIGGVVNVVPKKPTRGPIQNEIQTTIGTRDTYRLGLGSGGALDDHWSYRLDLSGNHSDAGMDLGRSRDATLSLALRYDVNPNLNFTLSHAQGFQEPTRYFGTPLIDGKLDYGLRDKNYNVNDASIVWRDRRTELAAQWTPNARTTVRSRVYTIGSNRDWRNAEYATYQPATGLIEQSAYTDIQHDQTQYGMVTDAAYEGSLFGMANRVAVGVEANRSRFQHTNNSPYSGSSLVDPYVFERGEFINVAGTRPKYRNTSSQYAVFTEDRLALTDRWSVIGGLRYDHSEVKRRDLLTDTRVLDRTYSDIGWRVGTVFDVLPTLAVYAQYAVASDPVGGLLMITPANGEFDLARGEQVEVGVKQTFWEGDGELTVAAYRIGKRDLVARDAIDPTRSVQVGKQSSRGIEATLGLKLARNWRLDANVAVLNAEYDDFNENVGGQAVSRAGNVPTDVPERLANAWLSWKFAPQWTASAGMRYVGKRYGDRANTLEMAGYTTTNLALMWQPRTDTTLTLRAFNVFDKQYAQTAYYNTSQWFIGEGRRVELTALYRF